MCCSSEQPLVGSEFGTDPNNSCEGDYKTGGNIVFRGISPFWGEN